MSNIKQEQICSELAHILQSKMHPSFIQPKVSNLIQFVLHICSLEFLLRKIVNKIYTLRPNHSLFWEKNKFASNDLKFCLIQQVMA